MPHQPDVQSCTDESLHTASGFVLGVVNDRMNPSRARNLMSDPEPLSTKTSQVVAIDNSELIVGPSPSLCDITLARIFVGRAATSYPTATSLELRRDHAVAVDAVQSEINLHRDLGSDLVQRYGLFEVSTQATSKREYLARPDLGRRLSNNAKELIRQSCPREVDLQVVIGDGLSATAVATQCPALLPVLMQAASNCRWTIGRPFLIRHCRVGVLNDIGEVLSPTVVVLLIGERPGLATSQSLSAYLAYQPRLGDTDAKRNLISNIHDFGVSHGDAVSRILDLVAQMIQQQTSGVAIKERLMNSSNETLANKHVQIGATRARLNGKLIDNLGNR